MSAAEAAKAAEFCLVKQTIASLHLEKGVFFKILPFIFSLKLMMMNIWAAK